MARSRATRRIRDLERRLEIEAGLNQLMTLLVHKRTEQDVFNAILNGGIYIDGGREIRVASLPEILHVETSRLWEFRGDYEGERRDGGVTQDNKSFRLLANQGRYRIPQNARVSSPFLEGIVRDNSGSTTIVKGRIPNQQKESKGRYSKPTGCMVMHFNYQRGDVVLTLSVKNGGSRNVFTARDREVVESLRRFTQAYLNGVYDARMDLLTGLLNQNSYKREVMPKLLDPNMIGYGAIIMLDIDHFKPYNDTHGHHEGDIALSRTGKNVRASIRDKDVAARFGGEEFFIYLPKVKDINALAMVCERIRQTIEGDNNYFGREKTGNFTVSVGGCMIEYGPQAKSLEPLVKRTDHGLYIAKGERNDDYKIIAVVSGEQSSSLTGGRNRSVVRDIDGNYHLVNFVGPKLKNVDLVKLSPVYDNGS